MLNRIQDRRNRRAAFTLMELLVVVAIIVVLAGIGGFFFLGQLETTKKDLARTQSKSLTQACETFFTRYGRWPQNLQELMQLPDGGTPLLKSQDALLDPWGQPYQFDVNGPMNMSLAPDIWAVSPTDGDKCGNWPKTNQMQQ